MKIIVIIDVFCKNFEMFTEEVLVLIVV